MGIGQHRSNDVLRTQTDADTQARGGNVVERAIPDRISTLIDTLVQVGSVSGKRGCKFAFPIVLEMPSDRLGVVLFIGGSDGVSSPLSRTRTE